MYRWLDHTAELELELEAATERDILSDALEALRELLEGDETGELTDADDVALERRPVRATAGDNYRLERRAVRATAGDRPALLAAWLEELLFLSESEAFIPLAVERLSLEDVALAAIVSGRVGEPRPIVKAVTYHCLQFEPSERGYRAHVVFDV